MRLGFVQHKIALSLSPILHKLDEGIGRKRVVLRRNAEPLPGLLRITVFRFQRVRLPYNLASVAEKSMPFAVNVTPVRCRLKMRKPMLCSTSLIALDRLG